MTYTPNVWTDRAVSTPNLYAKSGETEGQVTLVPIPGTVTQAGTPINATNMNKMEQGIAGAVPKGASNSEIADVLSLINEIDTRSVFVTRTNGLITLIEEKNGSTVMRATVVNRTLGILSSIVQTVNGDTITFTINRDASNNITSITKSVVLG